MVVNLKSINLAYIRALVWHCVDEARSVLGPESINNCEVQVTRYISNGDWARALIKENKILLSEKAVKLPLDKLAGLIKHELAHLIVGHGRHDDNWRSICEQLDGNCDTVI